MLVGLVRMSGIPASLRPDRIVAGKLARHLHVDIGSIKVTHPIPDIASHVVESISIWRERFHRRGPDESIFSSVLVGKFSSPSIGHVFPVGLKFIAPGVALAGEATLRGKLPLCF